MENEVMLANGAINDLGSLYRIHEFSGQLMQEQQKKAFQTVFPLYFSLSSSFFEL